jgi:hypothetical protein
MATREHAVMEETFSMWSLPERGLEVQLMVLLLMRNINLYMFVSMYVRTGIHYICKCYMYTTAGAHPEYAHKKKEL